MKSILEKFPKPVLIRFICDAGIAFRYKSADNMEGQLLYFQWEIETKQCLDEMDAVAASMVAIDKSTTSGRIVWFALRKRYEKWDRRFKKVDKFLEKANQLRGFE